MNAAGSSRALATTRANCDRCMRPAGVRRMRSSADAKEVLRVLKAQSARGVPERRSLRARARAQLRAIVQDTTDCRGYYGGPTVRRWHEGSVVTARKGGQSEQFAPCAYGVHGAGGHS